MEWDVVWGGMWYGWDVVWGMQPPSADAVGRTIRCTALRQLAELPLVPWVAVAAAIGTTAVASADKPLM